MSKAKTTPVSVRVGYRFHPTDEELVNYYLKQKMQGNDSEINGTIPEADVCNYEPTELYGKKESIFFTFNDYPFLISMYYELGRFQFCSSVGN